MDRRSLLVPLLAASVACLAACGSETADGIARGFGQVVPPGGGRVETYVDVLLADTSVVKAWIPAAAAEEQDGPFSVVERIRSRASPRRGNDNVCVRVRRLKAPRGTAETVRWYGKGEMFVQAWELVRIVDRDSWSRRCWEALGNMDWWNENVSREGWGPLLPAGPAARDSVRP